MYCVRTSFRDTWANGDPKVRELGRRTELMDRINQSRKRIVLKFLNLIYALCRTDSVDRVPHGEMARTLGLLNLPPRVFFHSLINLVCINGELQSESRAVKFHKLLQNSLKTQILSDLPTTNELNKMSEKTEALLICSTCIAAASDKKCVGYAPT